VRLSPQEQAMFRVLLDYVGALWSGSGSPDPPQARLVAMLLLKRALSSPGSLIRSVVRRQVLLGINGRDTSNQMPLPLEDEDAADDEPSAALAAQGLACAEAERAWLARVEGAARLVAAPAKLQAIVRLLKRVGQPAIVFSEYRDTVRELELALGPETLCTTLHGGMSPDERSMAIRAFTSGDAAVLLATDAAAAGLNLHHRCRMVIHLEIPWNPVRLEQRVGRVDRIGQTRRVHTIHLVARQTPEEQILLRLVRKAERARAAMADDESAWPGGAVANDNHVAEWCLGRPGVPDTPVRLPGDAPPRAERTRVLGPVNDRERARIEALRQERVRAITAALARPRRRSVASDGRPLVRVRVAARERCRGAGAVLRARPASAVGVFGVDIVDDSRRLADESLVAIRFPSALVPPCVRPRLRQLHVAAVDGIGNTPAIRAIVHEAAQRRLEAVEAHARRSRPALRARRLAQQEREHRELANRSSVQGGLFDHRAERESAADRHSTAGRPGEPSTPPGTDPRFVFTGSPVLGWLWFGGV
jgi:hypothetical protein